MIERVNLTAKKPEAKAMNSVSHVRHPALSRSSDTPVDHILFLQRTIGTQAVQRLIKSGALQAKFKIGHPWATYEQEADSVAESTQCRESGSRKADKIRRPAG